MRLCGGTEAGPKKPVIPKPERSRIFSETDALIFGARKRGTGRSCDSASKLDTALNLVSKLRQYRQVSRCRSRAASVSSFQLTFMPLRDLDVPFTTGHLFGLLNRIRIHLGKPCGFSKKKAISLMIPTDFALHAPGELRRRGRFL